MLSTSSQANTSGDTCFTFEVDKVEPKQGSLAFLNPEDAFHKQVGQELVLRNFSHENDKSTQLIKSSYRMSGVMKAIHAAYMNHYNLKLSVSDFILMIGQGLAQHMELHAEDLRSQFVDFQGKEKITIETMVLNWPVIIEQFGDEIKGRVKTDLYDVIIDDTSVATKLSKMASEITIMDSFKQYFKYEVKLICGIPKVSLVGSKDDWERLRSKVKKLQELNAGDKLKLNWWLEQLVPLVDNIVNQAVSRKADPTFWSSIYKFQDGKGYNSTPTITGWITKFTPYLIDQQNNFHQNDFNEVHPSSLASGVSKVPFTLKSFGKSEEMVLYGGFLGAQVGQDDMIEPVYFYAVGPDPNEKKEGETA